MSVQSVKAIVNGVDIILTYNASTGFWESSPVAPVNSSWGQENHKYGVTIKAEDTAGNISSIDRTDPTYGEILQLRVLEKVAPTITPISPTTGAFITTSSPTLEWTVTDSGSGINPDTISIKLDTASAITTGITKTPISNGYKCSYTFSNALSEGSHIIRYNVSDNDGNAATESVVSITVDTVPPTLNVEEPEEGSYHKSTTITVSGTTNDSNSPITLKVKVNNGADQSIVVGQDGSFSKDLVCSEGSNTLVFTATDAAGKTTTVTRHLTVDTKAPVFVEISISPNPVDAGDTYVIRAKVTDA